MTDLYATARAMLADLNAKRISARELLDAHAARNDALATSINAVTVDRSRPRAKDALAIDDARAKGASLGALAGLPMTIKDGYDVEHMPATAGFPPFAYRPKNCADAELVARTRAAGAVIWGKTNVPLMLGDWQSYNAIYGTTNNPYDATRVPGGSSGGAAAALATGITPLEIGSDIGGSLRMPANFCGVTSLKPTWGKLPMRGHVPPPPGIDAEVDLGVGGPMARNVDDLKLLWNVLNKSRETPRRDIKGARVAVWDEDPMLPLSRDVKDGVARAADALAKQGAKIETIKAPVDTRELLVNYMWLLISIISAGLPEDMLNEIAKTRGRRPESVRRLARSMEPGTQSPRDERAAERSPRRTTRAPGDEGPDVAFFGPRRDPDADHAGDRVQARSERAVQRAHARHGRKPTTLSHNARLDRARNRTASTVLAVPAGRSPQTCPPASRSSDHGTAKTACSISQARWRKSSAGLYRRRRRCPNVSALAESHKRVA